VYSFGILAWEVLRGADWDGGIERIAAARRRHGSQAAGAGAGADNNDALYQDDFLRRRASDEMADPADHNDAAAASSSSTSTPIGAPPTSAASTSSHSVVHPATTQHYKLQLTVEREFKRAVLSGRRPPLTADLAPIAPLLARCWLDAPHRRPPFSTLLPELGDIAMRASLAFDPIGVALWRVEFGQDVVEVPWSSFRVRFYASLNLPLRSSLSPSSSSSSPSSSSSASASIVPPAVAAPNVTPPVIKSPALFLNEIDEYMRAVMQQHEAAQPADAVTPGTAMRFT
jgi:hypothetical protein